MVNKDDAIVSLAKDILRKIKKNDVKLSNVLLQVVELSYLAELDENIKIFSEGAQKVEKSQVCLDTYNSNIEATKDPNISITSANPNQYVGLGFNKGNYFERKNIRQQQQNAIQTISQYKTQTYEFVMKIYYTYLFGQKVSSILDDYKKRVLNEILKELPELKGAFEVINKNIVSINPREWASAASECRNILIKLSGQLWKKKEKDFKSSNGVNMKIEGEKNKLIAYINKKVGGGKLKKARNAKLCAIVHEIFDIGGKQKTEIKKNELSTSVIDTYVFLAELITYTDLQPVV